MTRFEELAESLKTEILAGRHGGMYSRFETVRGLASRFGVSVSTAHKVIGQLKAEKILIGDSTNPTMIGPEVARRVAAADKISPRRFGLLVTDITNPFFSKLCNHIQHVAADLGYQALVASSGYDFDREQRAVRSFLEIGVDGLVICPGLADQCEDLYRNLIRQGVRLSFVSRRVTDVPADFVVIHNFAGGALMAGHLLSMNYRSFGYIAFSSRLKQDVRLDGFRSALLEEGYELPAERIVDADGWNISHGYQAMAQLMEGPSPPAAVFAFNDLLAIGAVRYCQEHRIAVPEKVAIAGFDNLPESQVIRPPLSTVVYPVESMARLAVQNLLSKVHEPDGQPSHILLEPHLVIRESTDPKADGSGQPSTSDREFYDLI